MHKFEYKGPYQDKESKSYGCPLFECRICGLGMISYQSDLVKALQGLNSNNRLISCERVIKQKERDK